MRRRCRARVPLGNRTPRTCWRAVLGSRRTDTTTSQQGGQPLMKTQTSNGDGRPPCRVAADFYRGRGYVPGVLAERSKRPLLPDWLGRKPSDRDLDEWFPPGSSNNIGLELGVASGNLVDVDLDCPEAVAVAKRLLPESAMKHGRASHPLSHWW